MDFLRKAIESIPQAAGNPLAFILFLATLIAWVWIAQRSRRLKLLLSRLEQVPTTKRAELIRAEMGVVLPEKISPEQWIRSRKHQYFLVGYLALCFLVLGLVGIISWVAIRSPSAELHQIRVGIDSLQTKLDEVTRGVGQLSIGVADVSGQVTAKQPETKQLRELTDQLESLVKQFATQIGTASLVKDDEHRIRRAEAAIQNNRGLLHLEQGNVTEALQEFGKAIGTYTTLVQQDGRQELEDVLARSLHNRGVILFNSDQKPAEAAKDLADAASIYARLVQKKGRTDLGKELAQSQAARTQVESAPANNGITGAIVTETSGVSAIVVTQLQGVPELDEVHVVKAGTSVHTSYYPVQTTKKLGTPMLVEPGVYDIFGKSADGIRITLVKDIELKAEQRIRVNPDALVSRVVVSPLALEGFPVLADTFVIKAGTDREQTVSPLQRTTKFGTPMLVEPGKYDILCTPAKGSHFTVKRDVELKAGETVRIDTDRLAAALVCRDPKMEGLELKVIYVVEAGTVLQGSFRVMQRTDGFEKPMMVFAGGLYDIVLKPVDGAPVKIAKNVLAKAGQLTIVCAK